MMDPFDSELDNELRDELSKHQPPSGNPLDEGCTCGMPGNFDYHQQSIIQMKFGKEHPDVFDMPLSDMMDKMRKIQRNMNKMGRRGITVIKGRQYPTMIATIYGVHMSYQGLQMIFDVGAAELLKVLVPSGSLGVDIYSTIAQISEIVVGKYDADTSEYRDTPIRLISETPLLNHVVGIAAEEDDKVFMFPEDWNIQRTMVKGNDLLNQMLR